MYPINTVNAQKAWSIKTHAKPKKTLLSKSLCLLQHNAMKTRVSTQQAAELIYSKPQTGKTSLLKRLSIYITT